MKSFRQYLWESDFTRRGEPDGPYSNHHYTKNIVVGPHQVNIDFEHTLSHGKGTYDVAFSVDNSLNRSYGILNDRVVPDPMHRLQIGHELVSSVDRFVHHVKPAAVRFVSHDSDPAERAMKAKKYEVLAKRLANMHGGTIERSKGVDGSYYAGSVTARFRPQEFPPGLEEAYVDHDTDNLTHEILTHHGLKVTKKSPMGFGYRIYSGGEAKATHVSRDLLSIGWKTEYKQAPEVPFRPGIHSMLRWHDSQPAIIDLFHDGNDVVERVEHHPHQSLVDD